MRVYVTRWEGGGTEFIHSATLALPCLSRILYARVKQALLILAFDR
jgi:hypothetical protein